MARNLLIQTDMHLFLQKKYQKTVSSQLKLSNQENKLKYTYISKFNKFPLVGASRHQVTFRHIQHTAFIREMKVHYTEFFFEDWFDTSWQ